MSNKIKSTNKVAKAGKEPEIEVTKPKSEAELKKDKQAAEAAAKDVARATKDAERAASKKERDDKREKEKTERIAKREAAKAAKAAKPGREVPAHMAKVTAFRNTLPTPNADVEMVLKAAEELSTGDLCILASWISVKARERATLNASSTKVSIGDKVRIISGNTKFIGKVGEVTRCQRIRLFVTVEGFSKEVYLFNSDVELLDVQADTKTIDLTEEDSDESDTAANG